jgi:putative transposase
MSRRHPHRLPASEYVGPQRYFLTVCTFDRTPRFHDPSIARAVESLLQQHAAREGFDVPAYCLMPDHVHVLLEGRGASADLQSFVHRWKQDTAFRIRRSHGVVLWQRSYFDRTLRDDESTVAIAVYILENPVRAGLAAHPLAYPWLGSFTMDVRLLLESAYDV